MTITKNTALLRQLVIEHVAADSVIQGQYWNPKTHKGCFIGCLVHSDDPSKACELFGLTHPVLRIAEAIFEGLPKEEAVKFFSDFPDAIATDGKDLSLVHWKFLASELRDLPKASNEVQEVINTIIAGIDLLASGEHWDPAAARAAGWAAAEAAADAAAVAAADAEVAAARAAGFAAARSTVFMRQRDLLLNLICQA